MNLIPRKKPKPEKPASDRSLLGIELTDEVMPHMSVKFTSRSKLPD